VSREPVVSIKVCLALFEMLEAEVGRSDGAFGAQVQV